MTELQVRFSWDPWPGSGRDRCGWGPADSLGTRLTQVPALVPAARPVRRAGKFVHHGLYDTARVRDAVSRRGPPALVL